MTPTPFFDRSPRVRLYHGDSRELWPHLVAGGDRGIVMFDPQYSEHVHSKSRAGARKEPLRDGQGNLSRAAISRTKTFGFDPMTEHDRAIFAVACAAMTTRWCLVFSDLESCHLWRQALTSVGLEYVRTGLWHKLGATPQMTGDRPAVPVEAITICHAAGVTKRWNGHGRHAWWSHSTGETLLDSATALASYILSLPEVPDDVLRHALSVLMPESPIYEHQIVVEHGGSKEGEPRVHETQKPEGLMVQLVDDFSDEEEPVIDLTAGSSTTLVAAVRRGRHAVGVERRLKDCETGALRLEAELAGVAYYARKSGQLGMFEPRAAAPVGALS